jgi:acyl carrier protein
LRHATVRARPIASRSLIRANAPIEGEPLMDSESIGEVRSALAAFPGLGDVTVVEHGAGQADQCLIAYVVPSGPGLDVPELHAYARKTLSNGNMPAAIVVVDEIPVTAAGTVNAAALPVPELNGLLPYQAPATPRQEILCELFAQVLGVARCGIDTDFFDLGGRSVEAMVLAGRISTALGIRVSMADLFKASTAGDLDSRLDQMADARK